MIENTVSGPAFHSSGAFTEEEASPSQGPGTAAPTATMDTEEVPAKEKAKKSKKSKKKKKEKTEGGDTPKKAGGTKQEGSSKKKKASKRKQPEDETPAISAEMLEMRQQLADMKAMLASVVAAQQAPPAVPAAAAAAAATAAAPAVVAPASPIEPEKQLASVETKAESPAKKRKIAEEFCEECDDGVAVLRCEQCEAVFCHYCDTQCHQSKVLARHVRKPL